MIEPRNSKSYAAWINPATRRMELTLATIPILGDKDYSPKSDQKYMDLKREERNSGDTNEPLINFQRIIRVRQILSQWADYHESRSSSQPATGHSVEQQVAEDIYRFKKPMMSVNTPEPKLDLRVSDTEILLRCSIASKKSRF